MFLSSFTYSRFLVIALTMLVAVPCLAKKEMKQWLNIESNQPSKPVQKAAACNSFCQLQKQDRKENVENHIHPSPYFEIQKEHSGFAIAILLPGFYNRQKEKIPSYLLYERFLI